MKEAELEKKYAEIDYKKQSQHFDNNAKLREVLEDRKSKCEGNLTSARSNYVQAAQEAEPVLLRLYKKDTPDEDEIKKTVKLELRDYVRFRQMDDELKEFKTTLDKECMNAIRSQANREFRNYAPLSDHNILVEQVRGLTANERRRSVSVSDFSRDVTPKLAAQARDIENFKSETATQIQQQNEEISELKDQVSVVQKKIPPIHAQVEKMTLDLNVETNGLSDVRSLSFNRANSTAQISR
jgi:hypothetical protein